MKIIKILGWILISLVVIALVTALFLPSQYNVTRTALIRKPASAFFDKVAIYKNWNKWSPWASLDSKAVYSFTGVDGANGSKMDWKGDTVGIGFMQIKKIDKDKSIISELHFIKPFESVSENTFTFNEGHGNTMVSWTVHGEWSYPLGRLMSLFLNMDKLMGPDFEKGLQKLKKISESEVDVKIIDQPEKKIYYIPVTTTLDPKDISITTAKTFKELYEWLKMNKIEPAGMPISITTSFDFKTYNFECAVPVNGLPILSSDKVKSGILPAQKIATGIHYGSYATMSPTYKKIKAYIRSTGFSETGRTYEEYQTNPALTPDHNLITNICLPVK